MSSFLNKWRAVSVNTLFGAAKSVVAYFFIVLLYKYSIVSGAVGGYIDYEVWAAASILFTFGLQGHAYKTMASELLVALSSFFFVIGCLLFPWFVFAWAGGEQSLVAVIALLVVLDRGLDVALQVERQSNRFDLYNWNDIFNSLLVKAGFIAYSLGRDWWLPILVLKIVVLAYFIWRQMSFELLMRGFGRLRAYFLEYRKFAQWYAFDILNFFVMNLDLVLVRATAPSGFVELYFYIRKFVRLPLVLLNYVVDPIYISVRKVEDRAAAYVMLKGYLKPIFWGAFFSLFAIAGFLALQLDGGVDALFGIAVALTSFILVVVRFADLYVLLFRSQAQRILLRVLCLSGVALIPLSSFVDGGMNYAILLFPALGWIAASCVVLGFSARQHLFQAAYVALVSMFFYLGSAPIVRVEVAIFFHAFVFSISFGAAYLSLRQFISLCLSDVALVKRIGVVDD